MRENYISSYQCNPELVDLEFAQAKKGISA